MHLVKLTGNHYPDGMNDQAPINKNIVFLTMSQAAVMLDVTYTRISQMMLEPDPPPREADKTFRIDHLGKWSRDRAVRMALGGGKTRKPASPIGFPGADNPADEIASLLLNPVQQRARKDSEAADKLALENQLTRGELIQSAAVESKWTEIMLRIRSRLLRVPWSVAPLVIGEMDQIKIQIVVEDQIRDALSELAASEE